MSLVTQLERKRQKENRAAREKQHMAFKYQEIHDYALLLSLHDIGFGKDRCQRVFETRAKYLNEFIENIDAGADYSLYKLKDECKKVFGDEIRFVNGKD